MTLKGIGLQSAWLFTFEFFAWRNFSNRREVGALAGFTPTPFQSGDDSFDQGISKAGSSSMRAMAIQIAWGWLQFQPNSALTLWYQRRFARAGPRMRKIGIVAVARRLLIELWRFSETGALPDGAITSS
jgi:transposase